MLILQDILSQEIVQRLGWTLLHFIWQAAAVALILTILLRVLRKSTANLRYIIACLALALIVLLPVITIKLVPVSQPLTATQFAPAPAPTVLPTIEMPAPETIVITKPYQPEGVTAAPAIPLKQRVADTLEPALPYVVTGWLIGVFGLSLWHLGGWTQLQRLKRRMVKQIDSTLLNKLKVLTQKLKVKQTVQLMESALVQIPTVVGWLRPVILLPASALTGLSSEQLEAIIAHELAHIKRLDYLINILQTVVEILGFYHPAVWWVSHKIRAERENCCDDIAVSISGDRVSYAGALASMEEIRAASGRLAVAATGGNLFRRICRLLGKDSTDNTGLSWVPAATAILLIVALAIPTTLALTNKSDSLLSETKTNINVEDKSTESSEVRIVHFPTDRTVGVLKVRDPGSDDDSDRSLLSLPGWVLSGQAQDDVSVPAGKDLRLEIAEDVTDYSFLADLKPDDLQVLKLSHTDITDEDIVHLKSLSGLLGLDLGSTPIQGNGLVHLSTLTSLKKLSLFNTQVSDAGLVHLSPLKSLKHLNLYISQVKGPGLKNLKSLTSLVSLDLAATPITDESLAHLVGLTWLKQLAIYDTDIGNKGLAHLKPLRSLEVLILGHSDLKQGYSPITDEGLVYLKEMDALKSLYLLRTQVTDAGLAHLRNLKKLEALLLTETQITGEGLAFLKDLPELKYLDLNKTGLNEAGLGHLKEMARLNNLWLDEGSISKTSLKDLEKALPDCKINVRRVSSTVRHPKPEPILNGNIPILNGNIPPVPVLVTSPAPPDKDKVHVQIDCVVFEVYLDSKIDSETRAEAEKLFGNKINRYSKNALIMKTATEAMIASKDKSTENKRLMQDKYKAFIEMLTSKGYIKILMNPVIETRNGKTATIRSAQHVPLRQKTKASPEIEYVDVTDLIEITPHVHEDGHIILDVEASLGSRNIPVFEEPTTPVSIRSLSTQVRANPGKSLIIYGYGLGESSPAPGNIATNTKKQANDVLFIITPTIITPSPDSQKKTNVRVKVTRPKDTASQQLSFGTAVEGVQCRLQADKRIWQMGEVPTFKSVVRNSGEHDFHLAESPDYCLVQVDGRWFFITGYEPGKEVGLSTRVLDFLPGQQHKVIPLELSDKWETMLDSEVALGAYVRHDVIMTGSGLRSRLKLTPGKHIIHVSFILGATRRGSGLHPIPPIQVVSNPVEIEILPAKKTNVPIEDKKAESTVKLKKLGLAVAMYSNDHDDILPHTLKDVKPYIRDEDVFDWILDNVEYFDKGKTAQRNAQSIPIAYDKSLLEKADGTNILSLDFSVRFVESKEFEKLDIKRAEILIETWFLAVNKDFIENINHNADSPDEAKELLKLKSELLAAVDGHNTMSFIPPALVKGRYSHSADDVFNLSF